MNTEKHATLRFAGIFAEGDIKHTRALILGGGIGACAGAGFVLDMGGNDRVTGKTVLGMETQATAEYAALLAGLRMAYLSRVTHLTVECASAGIIDEMRTGSIIAARPVALNSPRGTATTRCSATTRGSTEPSSWHRRCCHSPRDPRSRPTFWFTLRDCSREIKKMDVQMDTYGSCRL
jgi:ribonuclease HI